MASCLDLIEKYSRHYFLLLDVYLMQNMKKNLLKCQCLCFFTTLYLIWPNFAPKREHPLSFFADFQWNMLGDSININNLCCNPVVLKKKNVVKSLTICFLGLLCKKRGHYDPRPKWKTIFVGRKNKSRSSAFRNFLFHQNISAGVRS